MHNYKGGVKCFNVDVSENFIDFQTTGCPKENRLLGGEMNQ